MKNPNHYGTIYKLSGRRRRPYTAVVVVGKKPDGGYIRKNLGYWEKKADAMAALSAYHQKPYDVAEKSAPLKEIWAAYVRYREDRKRPVTVDFRGAFLRHCEPLHDMPLSDIRPVHIQSLVDGVAGMPSVARRIKMIFSAVYKYARLLGLPIENISDLVEVPPMPKSTMHKPFTPEEIKVLWDDAANFVPRVALLYIYTGCRPQELFLIRREAVDVKRRVMVGGMKTKAGRNREIPIARKILPIIKDMMKRGGGEYLICDTAGAPVTYRQFRMKWAASTHPSIANHRMHDGRHTCETLLDNAGVNKRTIQLIIGHAGRDVDENVYTHKTTAQLIEAIDRI